MDIRFKIDDKIKSHPVLYYSGALKKSEGKPLVAPPASKADFESRVGELVVDLLEGYYGIACYLNVDERSTISKNPTCEDLVDLGIKYGKKFAKNPGVIDIPINSYEFLKSALKKGFPFTNYHQNYLGVYVEYSKLAIPDKNQIAVQATAQVLWYLEKEKIGTIEMMQKRLLEGKLFKLLELERFSISADDSATIRRWISKVFPKPKQLRKGRPSKKGAFAEDFSNLVTIPNIFVQKDSVTRTNYQMLHLAIICITKTLQISGWSEEQILESKIIQHYRESLVFYPNQYVDDWVKEAIKENGSIFDL